MKNNLQDKQAFFAQYWGQMIFDNGENRGFYVSALAAIRGDGYWANLTPLSAITDEDAIEVAKYMGVCNYKLERSKYGVKVINKSKEYVYVTNNWEDCEWDNGVAYDGGLYGQLHLDCADHLRSRGYLLPFRQYTTQQLLDMGWAKLKTK